MLPRPIVELKRWRLDGSCLSGYADKSMSIEFPDGQFCRFYNLLYTAHYPAGVRGPAFRYARTQGGYYIRFFEHDEEGYTPQPEC